MQPTFNSRGREYHDLVVLDKWNARQLNIRRGDVVVLRAPHNPDELLTKRVVGLPGDCVRPRPTARHGDEATHIPRGHLWIEGDNEHASNDSNSFGSVSVGLVEARVAYKLWPLSERGRIERSELSKERIVYRTSCENVAESTARSSGMLSWHLPRKL